MCLKFFTLFLIIFPLMFSASGKEAFGWPGLTGNWSQAKKVQVGTFYEKEGARSPLWFTNTQGILSEVYFPTIDQAQIKDSQFLVTDGKTFFSEEKKDLVHNVKVIHPGLVQMINEDPKKKFSIRHTFFTLGDSSTLIDEVIIKTKVDGLKFFLLTNPHLKNNASRDNLEVTAEGFKSYEEDINLNISCSLGFRKKSVGFVGFSDGYQDLFKNKKMDYQFGWAKNGNVASLGEVNLPRKKGSYKFYIVYQFSNNKEVSYPKSFFYEKEKENYKNSWDKYFLELKKMRGLDLETEAFYWRSLYTLKVHEDKRNRGALIASLSIPWGESQYENETGGYHLIWPRDLFHVSLALLIAGDHQTPLNALRFLKKIQYKKTGEKWHFGYRVIEKKGAFPQNTWVNGKEYWGGLQLDQVGYPIHLFYHLYLKTHPGKRKELLYEFSPMLLSALDFIQRYGPWSHQERWEENFGISPSTFSVATSALFIGSTLFEKTEWSNKLFNTASNWLKKSGDNIDVWTFTDNGFYGDGNYYLRVAGCQSYGQTWDPNGDFKCQLANSSRKIDQRYFLDQGFLKLVLLGLKGPDDYRVETSLEKVNRFLRVKTPRGQGWYRYSFDAYGEENKGRLWPLLGGEHGRYSIERYREGLSNWKDAVKKVDPILDSFVNFSNAGQMIPEQVFEKTGKGTGAATPLAWSHAEFIKLLWSKKLKKNVENPLTF
ncbi:MAG: glycoside hydrolase family 15 protein [Bdellovibrionota bacterium]|nr:glycoside hydrolase family 15 protein [Bdellovibrionota bacterium]